ncbi:MAG: hypothetical protein ACJA0Q_001423 [Saprospiraceae bacterium]|jgi:hypothetical protein
MPKQEIMVKYRRLSDGELKELEQEFKQFLIANGVHNEEWVKINKEQPDEALNLVDMFSDLVLEKSLEQIKYLIHATKEDLKVFWFQKKQARLVALKSNTQAIRFTTETWMSEIPEHFSNVECFTSEKQFEEKERSKELFALIKAGAQVSSEQMFKIVHELVKG